MKDNYCNTSRIALNSTNGLNGFILLVHIGTDARRTDKFYRQLPQLITELKNKNYQFVRIDQMFH